MLAALLTLSLVPSPASLQEARPKVERFEELGLTLTFPAGLTHLEPEDEDEDDIAVWSAKLGAKDVWIWLDESELDSTPEPNDVTERIRENVMDPEYDGPPFEIVSSKLVPGPFGSVPYASLMHGRAKEEGTTRNVSEVWYLGGVASKTGYLVIVDVDPVPDDAEAKIVVEFLTKGVVYSGPLRDPKWTPGELEKRWKDSLPKAGDKQLELEVLRTDHYVILTNSSGGKAFAKKMEEFYATIQRTFPFEDVPGQRLMPVFLFRTPDQYWAFCMKQFEETLEEARESKGVASRDFYATWYEAPNDPTHIHEATHQIFGNRLFLNGAGSWFQEGVAEYVETRPNDRNEVARLVKQGKHTPLRELIRLESLLYSSEEDESGAGGAGDNYKQAALVIEFLRESPFGKDKFLEWLPLMGNMPDNDVEAIESVFRRVYGVTVDELERKLQEYCKKR